MRGRRSGQIGLGEDLLFGRVDEDDFLVRVDRSLDWAPIDALFDGLYGDTGKPSHPPLTVFKMLLLSQWFNLSDPGCEAAVRDRISFMRFVGIGLADPVPDETVLVRFRRRLLDAGIAERVFGEVTRQLEANNLLIKRGSLVDASLVEAARRPPGQEQAPRDPDARWAKKGKRSVYGYKAHVAVDEGSDLIRGAILTPANVHDRTQAEALIAGDEGRWVADKGYADAKLSKQLRERGITDGILRKGYRNRALSAKDKAHNARYIPIRAPVERIFADLKQHRGLRRMRYVGRAKGQLQLTLLAIAHNLRTMLRCTPQPRPVL